jgi:glycosyltransferase involved in cell wall biosynthesis
MQSPADFLYVTFKEQNMSWAGPFQFEIGKTRNAGKLSPGNSFAALPDPQRPTLLCLSHLRWNFVYQRPQHLMSRFARTYQVLFFEEPVATEAITPWLDVSMPEPGVRVLVPRIPASHIGTREGEADQRRLLNRYLTISGAEPVLWYYTPMNLAFTDHLDAPLIVYDCMDELSAFRGAPPELIEREQRLMKRADLVFTGGVSLYEAKKRHHSNAHPFPSSVDLDHFRAARSIAQEPEDQAHIPHPRLGFYGVIDERLDIELVDAIAAARPDWHIVLVGPVVKIDPATLPRRPNIHYLGPKVYDELPQYLGGWDVALMPFAINESTRFISPTKTPEYMAGGRPVVSTPIRDVVRTYATSAIVRIARDAHGFIAAIEDSLDDMQTPAAVAAVADHELRDMSWDNTWENMNALMDEAIATVETLAYQTALGSGRRTARRVRA